MELAEGKSLGPYKLVSRLGEGGMGEVWKALDTRLDRTVAIKVSKREFSERFEREARAVAALNHPNICQLYDVGPNYLVMEYVDGAPLKGPLPMAKVREYGIQILDALDAAHRKGIAHRDLKPANVLVTRAGVKLLDFGLAKQTGPLKQTDATLTATLTEKGEILGTLQYMSPEQLQSKPTDARSDLFSFGCVLYELITGRRAFEGDSAASVIAAVMERQPEAIEGEPELSGLIQECLAKDREERIQTAREARRVLVQSDRAPVAEAAPTQRATPWKWVTAALAAALVAALLWPRSTPPEQGRMVVSILPPKDHFFVYGNSQGGLALSPDGRMLAFVASDGYTSHLFIRSLDSPVASKVNGTEGAYYPFWSPDGKEIGFQRQGALLRIAVAGGQPRLIIATDSLRGSSWSADGTMLFSASTAPISRTRVDSMKSQPLTKLEGGHSAHYWPQFLPDGDQFLYLARVGDVRLAEGGRLVLSRVSKPEERHEIMEAPLKAEYIPPSAGKSGYLVWASSGGIVARSFDVNTRRLSGDTVSLGDGVSIVSPLRAANFSVSASGLVAFGNVPAGAQQLMWFSRDGIKLRQAGAPGIYRAIRLAGDDRRALVVGDFNGTPEATVIAVEAEQDSRLTLGLATSAAWFPDHKSIALTTAQAGSRYVNLFRRDVSSGGTPQRLTETEASQTAPDVSPDGRALLYTQTNPAWSSAVWVMALEGDTKPALIREKTTRSPARWSPDGKWIALTAVDQSGATQIFVQRYPQGAQFQVSQNGGQSPSWRADGAELYYRDSRGMLIAVPVKASGDLLQFGTQQPLFRLPGEYAPSRDGKRFLVAAPAEQRDPGTITIVMNWR